MAAVNVRRPAPTTRRELLPGGRPEAVAEAARPQRRGTARSLCAWVTCGAVAVTPHPAVASPRWAAPAGVSSLRRVDVAMALAMAAMPVAGIALGVPAGAAVGALAAGLGVAAGRIDGRGLTALATFALLSAALPLTPLGHLTVAVAALPFLFHAVPGFNAWQPFGAERLRADAQPYTQTVSPHKHLVGSLCWLRLLRASAAPALTLARAGAVAGIAGATIAVLMGAGLATGYVAFDPHPPGAWRSAIWLADNLLLTCVTEEAVFRGLMQPALAALAGGGALATAVSIALSAGAFGLVHHRGGATYVALSTVAGVGYGAAAQVARSVGGGVAAHLGLNTVHFLAFTYPARAPALPRIRGAQPGPPRQLGSLDAAVPACQ